MAQKQLQGTQVDELTLDLSNTDGSVLTNVDALTLGTRSLGTGPYDIPNLDGASRLPAVDGIDLTNVLHDLTDDTSPQLAGALNTAGFVIETTDVVTNISANNITINPGDNSYGAGGNSAGSIILTAGVGTNGNTTGSVTLTSGGTTFTVDDTGTVSNSSLTITGDMIVEAGGGFRSTSNGNVDGDAFNVDTINKDTTLQAFGVYRSGVIQGGFDILGRAHTIHQPVYNDELTRKDYVDSHVIQKNYIINPTFSVNQRGFAGGALATGIFGYDRFSASGASNMTTSNGTLTIVSGGANTFVEYPAGVGTMTLSWEGTTTGASVWSGAVGGDTGVQSSPLTFTPDGTTIKIYFPPGTLLKPKLEIGSIVTPFEYPEYGSELIKCQRYFEEVKAYVVAQQRNTTPIYYTNEIVYSTPKRIDAVTILVTAATYQKNNSGEGSLVTYSTLINEKRKTVFRIDDNIGQETFLSNWTFTASAEL